MKGSFKLKIFLCLLVIKTVCVFFTGCGTESGQGREDAAQETVGNPAAEPGERTVLTAAVMGSNPDMEEKVNAYNESSKTYFVQIKDYEPEVFDGNPMEQARIQLTLDILSGKGPDLVIWSSAGYSPSVASGKLMVNLYDYMEADKEFQKENYYENIMEAFELEGRLYTLPAGFSVETVCGKAEEIGTDRGVTECWEMGEMITAFENSPHAEWLTMNYSKLLAFNFVCQGCIGNFVDWETGECYFDTPAFAELLKLSDTFPDQLALEADFSYYEMLRSGKVFWEPVLLTDPWVAAKQRVIFGEADMRWPGYPVADGEKDLGGGVARPCGESFSICQNSRNQEAAWEFIKSYFTEEMQREIAGIPLLRSVSEERLQAALTVEYETVEGVRQEKVRQQVIAEGEDTVGLTCITEEDAEIFRSIIDNTHRSYSNDSGMMDIILEEVSAYFEKGKDAAAVADVIQNRVSVYVSERIE